MGAQAQKSFVDIQSDYRFFEEHSSERSQCLQIWHPHLQALQNGRSNLRMLDFGCGSGSFTAQVLARLPEASKLRLALVEPVAEALAQAQATCAPYLCQPLTSVSDWKFFPEEMQFDLILSHHVLYYLDPLLATLQGLLAHLKPGGKALLVVSQFSSIGQLQGSILQHAGITNPYHSGTEVLESLAQVAPVQVEGFSSQLRMADTLSHRRRILNFLVGEFAPLIDWDYALSAFDPYSRNGEIVMNSQEMNLVVRA
jgi:SAM-dependent methyltransferase